MAADGTETKNAARKRMRAPERRAQLLEVARKVFGGRGFHSVTMDTVAREAGVTKPILYDHFPSKRELYLALLEADLDLLRTRLHTALQAPTGNRQRIRASFQAYFDFVDDHAEGFRLLMQEAIGGEREFREMVGQFRNEVLREVAELILRESRDNVERAEAEALALGLIGMVETAAQQNPGDSKPKRRAAVNTLVRLAWKGISGLTL
jgi:AcrR family transcriptional regulator